MKVLVKYVVFIPNNYQGGVGDTRDFDLLLDFHSNTTVSQVKTATRARIELEVKKITHGWDDNCYQIISSYILNEA